MQIPPLLMVIPYPLMHSSTHSQGASIYILEPKNIESHLGVFENSSELLAQVFSQSLQYGFFI